MPVVPVEQNRVGLADVQGAKFRTPNLDGTGGEGLAKAVGIIGQAVGQYAADQDALQDHADKINARDANLSWTQQATQLVREYKAKRGQEAMDGGAALQKQLSALRRNFSNNARNQRERRYFDEFTAPAELEFSNSIADHARGEQFEFSKSTYQSEATQARELAALNAGDPEKQAKHIEEGLSAVGRFGKLLGWDEGTISREQTKFTSGAHRDAIEQMLAVPDPNIEQVDGYFRQHQGSMTAQDRLAIMTDLQKPLQARSDRADFTRIMATLKPVEGSGSLIDPGTARGAFMSKVRSVESSGNDNARATTSSATGRYQFTNGTWLSYYKRRYGDQGLTDEQILAKRTDGVVQDKLMADLTDDNEKALRDAGVPVTPGSLYLAHFAGADGARRLLTGDPSASAETVLGSAAVRANSFLRGKTAKEVIAWADKKMGSTGNAVTPSAWDKDEAYGVLERAAAAENWSLEKQERMRALVDREISTREELLKRQQGEASDTAFKAIVELGDNFTSITQIPRAVRDQMSAQDLDRFTEQADKNKEALSKVPEKGDDWLTLQMMMRAEPERFRSVDLKQYLGKVTANELNDLRLKQVDMLSKPDSGPNYREGINKAIAWGKKYGGIEVKDKDFPAVYDTMQDFLKQRAAKGPLTDADYDAAFKSAVTASIKTTGGGLFGMGSGQRAPYELTYDMLSDDAKAEAWSMLRRKGVQTPTKGQVLQVARTLMAGD